MAGKALLKQIAKVVLADCQQVTDFLRISEIMYQPDSDTVTRKEKIRGIAQTRKRKEIILLKLEYKKIHQSLFIHSFVRQLNLPTSNCCVHVSVV